MSGKLDQSLGDIISTQRRTAGRRRSTRRPGGRPAVTAPVGGVQKTTKPARNAVAKPAPAKAALAHGESKIIVSNLPKDVSEAQIKEYFVNAVGPIKRVELTYGPNGLSRGIANVSFARPDGATKASSSLNGLLVDGKPIKIEVVVGAAQAADLIPPPKSLTERISQPKPHPKSAAADKKTDSTAKATGAGARGRGNRRRGRTSRPAKKTAEELDSEMADYFNENANGGEATTAAAPAAANGDAAMDDGIE